VALKHVRTEAQRAAERNLVHFKPGQSGNPSGRPKDQPNFAAAVDRMLVAIDPTTKRTLLEEVVRVLFEAVLRAEPWAMEMLVKRLWPVPVGVSLNAQVAVVPDVEDALKELERALDKLQPTARAPEPGAG